MFSKFLQCQDEDGLAAVKMQFQMEFAKATRKFKKNTQKKAKQKGRPALGQLELNKFLKKFERQEKMMNFTKIARKVATTREGQRRHNKVTKEMAKGEKTHKPVCFCLLFVCLFVIN